MKNQNSVTLIEHSFSSDSELDLYKKHGLLPQDYLLYSSPRSFDEEKEVFKEKFEMSEDQFITWFHPILEKNLGEEYADKKLMPKSFFTKLRNTRIMQRFFGVSKSWYAKNWKPFGTIKLKEDLDFSTKKAVINKN